MVSELMRTGCVYTSPYGDVATVACSVKHSTVWVVTALCMWHLVSFTAMSLYWPNIPGECVTMAMQLVSTCRPM